MKQERLKIIHGCQFVQRAFSNFENNLEMSSVLFIQWITVHLIVLGFLINLTASHILSTTLFSRPRNGWTGLILVNSKNYPTTSLLKQHLLKRVIYLKRVNH